MCTGYWENCECEDCQYVSQLYQELDMLESFEPENRKEIERLTYEIESMGYTV